MVALAKAQGTGFMATTELLLLDLRSLFPDAGTGAPSATSMADADAWLAEARKYEADHGVGSRLDRTNYLVLSRDAITRVIAGETCS